MLLGSRTCARHLRVHAASHVDACRAEARGVAQPAVAANGFPKSPQPVACPHYLGASRRGLRRTVGGGSAVVPPLKVEREGGVELVPGGERHSARGGRSYVCFLSFGSWQGRDVSVVAATRGLQLHCSRNARRVTWAELCQIVRVKHVVPDLTTIRGAQGKKFEGQSIFTAWRQSNMSYSNGGSRWVTQVLLV